MQNLSYEIEFDLLFSELVSKNDLHMKGVALGLVLKPRQRELRNGLLTIVFLGGKRSVDGCHVILNL